MEATDLIKQREKNRKRREAMNVSVLKNRVPLPADDMLLVHRLEVSEVSEGGIELPESARKAIVSSTGRVMVAGDKCTKYQPGDMVIMTAHDGAEIPLPTGAEGKDELWIFIKESGIVGQWVPKSELTER